ncbi:MAG: hypothetical protein HY856_18025 [Burkholderiales bacterium]|nr:hypothetical protein [Burkholderiales bacterium]
MIKPPVWFYVVAVLALLWNAAGLMAVVADLRLSASDIATLPADQQAMHAARPAWSVVGSVVAVVAGTLGCLLLLLRRRWAVSVLAASLVGVVVQDVGLFGAFGAAGGVQMVALALQGLVLLIAIGLLLLARRAIRQGWITSTR